MDTMRCGKNVVGAQEVEGQHHRAVGLFLSANEIKNQRIPTKEYDRASWQYCPTLRCKLVLYALLLVPFYRESEMSWPLAPFQVKRTFLIEEYL